MSLKVFQVYLKQNVFNCFNNYVHKKTHWWNDNKKIQFFKLEKKEETVILPKQKTRITMFLHDHTLKLQLFFLELAIIQY